jgi:tetratricopeptide (TPR) repeat protein
LPVIILGVFLFSLLTARADDSDPARRVTLESVRAQAASLLERGDADDAYELYMRLLRENSDDDAVRLGLAQAAARLGRWNQAVLALEMLLEKYPAQAALYDHLAHAYLALNDRASAEEVQRMKPAAGRDSAAFPLDALAARYDLLQVHGKIRAGLLYDSNANLGPESDFMHLGNWRVSVPNASEKGTAGVYVGAEADFSRRFYRDSPWHLVGDARALWRGNAESSLADLHARESQWVRGALGLRRLTSTILSEVRLKGEIFDYELFQNVSAIGPEATVLWAAAPSLHLISKGGIDRRIYSQDSGHNGLYGWIGEYARFFFGADNHEFILGGRLMGASANDSDYGYKGWEANARFIFKLPYGFEFSPFASYAREKYNGPATALEIEDRRDERLRLGGGLTCRIDEAWSVELLYQYSRNHSISNLYEYEQHYISSGLAWSF